jgi:SAM-dependent methyltransferase
MPALTDRPLLAPTGEASPAWPAEVRAELARRRHRLTATAGEIGGRVLDLGDPETLTRVLAAGRSTERDPRLRDPNAEAGLRGPNAEPGLRDPNAGSGLRGPNAEAGAEPDPSGPAAVVLSVAALVAVADLPLALRGVERVLDPDGRFLFVEPVTHPGWAGVLAASAGSVLAPVRTQHLGRDVPLAVRRSGLIITDLERFTMPTAVWPLRSFVDGCARPQAGFAHR